VKVETLNLTIVTDKECPEEKVCPEPEPCPEQKPNINLATASDLEAVPGVGPSKAVAVINDIALNGYLENCLSIPEISGVSPTTALSLCDHFTVTLP